PEFEAQTDVKAVLTVPGSPDARVTRTWEKGLLLQPVLLAMWPVEREDQVQAMTVQRVYEATLLRRRLVAGGPAKPPAAMARLQRTFYLAANPYCDHASEVFQAWLTQQGLRRAKAESDLAFGHRVLKKLTETHSYRWVPGSEERSSLVCHQGWSHCSGLSNL